MAGCLFFKCLGTFNVACRGRLAPRKSMNNPPGAEGRSLLVGDETKRSCCSAPRPVGVSNVSWLVFVVLAAVPMCQHGAFLSVAFICVAQVSGEGTEEKYLIATSEQPMCAFHKGEWLKESDLPLR